MDRDALIINLKSGGRQSGSETEVGIGWAGLGGMYWVSRRFGRVG